MVALPDRELAAAAGRLLVGHDGDEYVLGRPDLGIYVVVPEPGAVLIRSLQAGESLQAATDRASAVAGEQVDGDDFLAGLAAAGLWEVEPVAGPAGSGAGTSGNRPGRGIRWIEGVSPAVARPLFGPVAWTGYGLATGFTVVVLVVRPDLWPRYEDFWLLPDPVLSVLVMLPIGLVLTALHEVWHWLAGRALGVPAIFRVSYRGIFLVFETDLTQLVATPRRHRYSAFLAGMAFDVVVLAAALGLRLAHRVDLVHLAGWVDRLLAALVLIQLLRLIWQWAAVFLRSDGYAVLANALRCHDLYRATWLVTKDRLWGLQAAERAEFNTISDHDRRVAQWFGLFYLAGLIAMGWMLVTYVIPLVISMVFWVGHNLAHPSLSSFVFWESVAAVLVVAGPYAVLPLLAWRERRRRRTGALR